MAVVPVPQEVEQPIGHMVELHDGSPPPVAAVVVRPTGPAAIVELLHVALEKNVPVEALEKLQAMLERASDREAAAEFADAVAGFQAACPSISKNKTASIVSSSGGSKFSYTYAELDHIATTIAPILQRFGLSYSWDSEILEKLLRVTCTLRHKNGHHVSSRFTTPTESRAGMTDQQKFGAALSYGKRQSLTQVLGLTTCDPDTDGADPVSEAKITEQQAADLESLASDKGLKMARILKAAEVSKVADILAADYDTLVLRVKNWAPPKAKAEPGDAAE